MCNFASVYVAVNSMNNSNWKLINDHTEEIENVKALAVFKGDVGHFDCSPIIEGNFPSEFNDLSIEYIGDMPHLAMQSIGGIFKSSLSEDAIEQYNRTMHFESRKIMCLITPDKIIGPKETVDKISFAFDVLDIT